MHFIQKKLTPEYLVYQRIYDISKKDDMSLQQLNKLVRKLIKYMKSFEFNEEN